MVARCCVAFCTRTSREGSIAFHEFPADLKLHQKWIKAIHHEGFTLHFDSQRACSDHFKQTDYIEGKKRRLIKGSVPSIFPKCSRNLLPNQASTSVHQTIQEKNDSSSSLQHCPLPTINTAENQCVNLHCASHQPLWSSPLGEHGLLAKAWDSQASTKQTVPSWPAQPLGSSTLGECGLPTEADSQDQTLPSSVDQSLGSSPLGEHGLPSKACCSQAATKQTLPSSAVEPLDDEAALLAEISCPLKPSEDIWFGCCSCTFFTRDQRGILSHLANHGDEAGLLGDTSSFLKATENVWFRCSSCTYITGDHRGIVSHLVAHGDEQIKCHNPPMSPGSRSKVHSSCQMDRGEMFFKCKLCPQAFAHHDSLTQHNQTHIRTREKPFKCNLCPKAFSRKTHLRLHSRTHSGEKPYKCTLCSQAFAQKGSLTLHNRVHTGEKPYLCKLCPQAFIHSSNLIRHNRTHCGEKPYKCTLCSQAFAQNGSLILHNRVHSGEKPYMCKLCPQAFTDNSNLIHHNRTHIGEKPYKCKLCPQAFSHHSNLTRHNRAHSEKL